MRAKRRAWVLRLLSRLLPFLFWGLVIFGFESPSLAVLTIIAAVIHELGHILVAMRLGLVARLPHGVLFGMKIRLGGCPSYRARILVLLGGPLANFLAALVAPLIPLPRDYITLFSALNIATALSNLLPAEGYDGYGVLFALSEAKGVEWGLRALPRLSFAVSVLFTFFSLYLIGRLGWGYWIFGIFFSSMISKLSSSIKSSVF